MGFKYIYKQFKPVVKQWKVQTVLDVTSVNNFFYLIHSEFVSKHKQLLERFALTSCNDYISNELGWFWIELLVSTVGVETNDSWNHRFFLEPPQLIRDSHYMVLPQNLSKSHFHHAKFQLLLINNTYLYWFQYFYI